MKKIFTSLVCLLSLQVISPAQPGALDPGFAAGGKFTMPCSDFDCYNFGPANAVAIQPNGKILLAGGAVDATKTDPTLDFSVTRLNPNGKPDKGFGKNGTTYIDFSPPGIYSYDEVLDVALQTDGKIVVVGAVHSDQYDSVTDTYNRFDIGVARFNTDGSPDNSFSDDGKLLIDLSAITGVTDVHDSYDFCRSVTIKSNGKICIAGDTFIPDSLNPYNYDAFVIQLNSDGKTDEDFGRSGIKIFYLPTSNESIYKIAVQGNDKLVLAGYSFSPLTEGADFLAIRLKPDGKKDHSFGVNGINVIDLGFTDFCYSMALQDDGKILLGGTQNDRVNFTWGFALTRLNNDGTFDKSFSEDGIQTFQRPNDANDGVGGLALQKDGKIIQTGRFGAYANYEYYGSSNFEVIRFNANGSIDSSFGQYGRSVIDFGNWTDYVQDESFACAIQADGKIIAAGRSEVYLFGHSGPAAVRLLADGKHVTLETRSDQTVNASLGECTLLVNDIDPIINPAADDEVVDYELYGATTDSGKGSVSGKLFNPGVTTVIYTLKSDPLQRTIFNVIVDAVAGGALDFDGKDDRVDLGFVNAATDVEYSFEAWINVRNYGNDKYGSFIFGDERNANGGIYLGLDSSGYINTYHPNTGFVVSSYKVPLHEWTHIAIVQSYTKMDLYVNGNFIQTLLTLPNLPQEVLYNTFYLGAYTNDFETYSRHFNGRMDEIRVWRTAICAAQIQNNLHCELAPEYSYELLDYYKINQGVAICDNPYQAYLSAEVGYGGNLENFALSGNRSNWVKGYIHDTCPAFSPLSLSCPGVIEVVTDTGECGKNVDFDVAAKSGCSPDVTITYSHEPGSFFPPGETWVTVTARNGFGNTTECSFYVRVRDPLPPTLITRDTSIALGSYGYAQINSYDVVAELTDDCEIDPYYGLDVYPTFFSCDELGPHTVTVTATDVGGNTTTKTAIVTVTPFIANTTVKANPASPQYSDPVKFTATIHDADIFSIYDCFTPPDVTFKIDERVLGTVALSPDGFGSLVGTLDMVLKDSISSGTIQPGKAKVTAVLSGGSGDAVQYNEVVAKDFTIKKENARIEYVASQFIQTQTNSTEANIPVAAIITDINDEYRGDIRNASVTFTIEPATTGASVIGSNTIVVPALSLINNDHTGGIAKGQFKVSAGGENTKAKFNVKVTAGNYYIGEITVPVVVAKKPNDAIAGAGIPQALVSKSWESNAGFNVVAMPNPSQSQFSLKVFSSNRYEKINIRVLDVTGRLIEARTKLNLKENILLGQHYMPGLYMVEITQGQNKKIIRLIKQ